MTWSTTEPESGLTWENEATGKEVQYTTSSSGSAWYAVCATARLKDNSVCVRVKVYTSKVYPFSRSQTIPICATVTYNGETSVSDSVTVIVGDDFSLRATWYCTLGKLPSSAAVTAGGGRPNLTVSAVTITVPKSRGAQCHVNVNGSWKEAAVYVNGVGVWKEAEVKTNIGGNWK